MSAAQPILTGITVTRHVSKQAVIDVFTKKATALWRYGLPDPIPGSYTTCPCGVHSLTETRQAGNYQLDSLTVHVLAFHRDQLTEDTLLALKTVEGCTLHPSREELHEPLPAILARLDARAGG